SAAVAVAGTAVTLVYRIQWLTIAITLVWGGLAIFFWSMKMTPPMSYRRHLKEIHQGLSRQTIGRAVQFSQDATHREGLDFYALVINIGEKGDPEDERLFYWDAHKSKPDLSPGDLLEIISHGNDIIGMRKLPQSGAEK
ncbi:MAG TPA: hypothetical protein PKE04_18640, partial [Clostridia bacterium]|nr:hypothetical protein [Clostridia bacterium]